MPLPHLCSIAGKSKGDLQLVADCGKSNVDDINGFNQPGSDVINDNDKMVDAELVDDNDEDMYLSDKIVSAKALKRKERMAKMNMDVDVDVVLEITSESKDRPKKKVRVKVVENESEVEIIEEPLSHT
jgi:uncharacterized surface anchored protein